MNLPSLHILGTRGVPAAHGGFETFAENFALYLVDRGWNATVYCQDSGRGPIFEDTWRGIQRIHIPIEKDGPVGTIAFDWKAVRHAAKHAQLCLTLGYNTAVFCAVLRLAGIPNLINMDGLEWARAKWSRSAKAWLRLNERAGCYLGTHLVADHPLIKAHLARIVSTDKITTIAYGADRVGNITTEPVTSRGLQPGNYYIVVARPEPENSILEIVSGFSSQRRGAKLAVLGHYKDSNPYHRAVKGAAGDEVVFLDAIYDKPDVPALRYHALAYLHGHQVGGTNPSLVEALGAGNPVIAHDNRFNRWVAGEGARYFGDQQGFTAILDDLIANPGKLQAMAAASHQRYEQDFAWPRVLRAYEELLGQYLPEAVDAVTPAEDFETEEPAAQAQR